MKKMTNKAANVFQNQSSLTKGDRLFVFMPRSPELYFSVFGALKLGVIVGPLFDVFKEDAVYERLVDSEAKAIVTTPELLRTSTSAQITAFRNDFSCWRRCKGRW